MATILSGLMRAIVVAATGAISLRSEHGLTLALPRDVPASCLAEVPERFVSFIQASTHVSGEDAQAAVYALEDYVSTDWGMIVGTTSTAITTRWRCSPCWRRLAT